MSKDSKYPPPPSYQPAYYPTAPPAYPAGPPPAAGYGPPPPYYPPGPSHYTAPAPAPMPYPQQGAYPIQMVQTQPPANPGYPVQPGFQYQQANPNAPIAVAHFDSGARFDGIAGANIPPPPPGCAPNAAQMASAQGRPVVGSQKKADWFSGGSGGGVSFW